MDIEAYAKYQQAYTQPVPKLLEDILRNQFWQSLLDLGCGDGALLYQLQKQGFLQGKKVWAVDLSATRMELVKSINPSITCLVRSADQVLEVASGSVDVIVSTQVIEHVPDQATMAEEIARMLALQGQAYISTVFKKWYGWYFYRCQGKWVIDPTHLREYSSDQELIERSRRKRFASNS
jgi:2-polyprenyl-3-methyl-5-hydroxy-6-metoxy-1,4-benzoquinol methylase